MVREIVLLGEEVLRRKAKPVKAVDASIRKLIDDMTETMHDADGVGLAAPQVSVAKRVIVVHDGECEPFALVNPRIVAQRGRKEGVEGCLSMPGLQGMVPRARELEVSALDLAGRTIKLAAEGFLARVIQHEIDHLNGVLFIDHTDELWWLEQVEGELDEDGDPVLERVPATLPEIEAHFADLREQRAVEDPAS